MKEIVIRHAEAQDAGPLRQIFAQPEVYRDLLQLPYPPAELWQKRLQPHPGRYPLVSCIHDEIAGYLGVKCLWVWGIQRLTCR